MKKVLLSAVVTSLFVVSQNHAEGAGLDPASVSKNSPPEYSLNQESGEQLVNPEWQQIEFELRSIDLNSNSFFVLDGKRGYVQTAGTENRLTVEYRDVRGDTYSHYRIGREPLSDNFVAVLYSGGEIRVRESEVLTLTDCLAIFKSYFEHGKIPDEYHLRELGDDYL